MKKIRRIFIGLFIAVTTVLALFSAGAANAATSPYLSVRYNTYKLEDYEKKMLYSDGHIDSLMQILLTDLIGYSYGKNQSNITASINLTSIESENDLITYWNDKSYFASPDGNESAYAYYNNQLPSDIFGEEYTFTYSTNGFSKITSFKGEEIPISCTNTFKPGDDIVIEPMVTITGALLSGATISIDRSVFASNYTTDKSDYYLNISTGASSRENGFCPTIGFLYSDEDVDLPNSFADGEEVSLGGIHVTLDNLSGGTYPIKMQTTSPSYSNFTPGFISGSKYDTYASVPYDGTATRFVETAGSITIQGASTKTGMTDFTLGGTKVTVGTSTFDEYDTTEEVDTPSYVGKNGEAIVGATLPSGTTLKSYTPTFTSSPYGYTDDVTFEATIEDLGTIAGIRYSTGEDASIEDALENGDQASSTGGVFTIPMDGATPGGTVYAVVDVVASDGVTTETYVFILPKAKSTVAKLESISFAGDGNPNAVKLQDTSKANTTFASGTEKYYIAVASNTKNITVTPVFDTPPTNYYQTCKVNGTAITSGNTSSNIPVTDGSVITVIMTAQDGDTTKTYEFTVRHLSVDTELSKLTLTAGDQTIDATYDSSTKTYTIDDVAYANKTFKLTPTFKVAGQTVTIGSTSMTNGTASSFNFNASSTNYAAYTEILTMSVTAEAGNTESYTINVNRVKADNNNTLTDLVLKDNNGNSIGSFDATTQQYTLSAEKLDSTITSVTATATAKSEFATVTVNGANSNTGTVTFSGTAEQTKTFTIVVTPQAGTAQTITVNVIREKADDTRTFTVDATADMVQDGTGTDEITMSLSGTTLSNSTALEYGTSKVTITITPDVSTTSIKIDGVDYTNKPYEFSFTPNVNAQTYTKSFVLYTEANQTTGYSYTIKLTTANAEDKYNFTFQLTDTSGSVETQTPETSGNTYTYTLDPNIYTNGTFKVNVTPESTKAKIYTSNDNSNDAALKENAYNANKEHAVGTTLYVTVFSLYGNKKTVTIVTKWADNRDKDNKIKMITVDSGTLNYVMGTNDYTVDKNTQVTVPFTTTEITFTVTKNSQKSSLVEGVSGVAQKLKVGKNTFKFQLEAENETLGDVVTIDVVRETGLQNAFLESLEINGINCSSANNINTHQAYTKYDNTIDFVLPRTSMQAYVAFAVSTGAVYRITELKDSTSSTSNNSSFPVPLASGSYTQVKIEIWSQYDSIENPMTPTNTYNVYIYAASQDYSLDKIEIYDQENGNYLQDVDNKTFTSTSDPTQPIFTVAYKVKTAYIQLLANDSFAKVTTPALKNLTASETTPNSFKYEIVSEYQSLNPRMTSQKAEYTVRITRKEASTTDTLDTLSVKIGDEEKILNFNPSSTAPYKIENIDASVTQATITYTKTDELSVVTGDTGPILTLDLISNNSQTFHVYVQSELNYDLGNNTKRDYQIIISKQEIVLDDNCEVTNITAVDGEGTLYMDKSSAAKVQYLPATKPYNINIPATLSSLTFTVEKAVTTSKLYLDGVLQSSLTFNISVDEGQNKTIAVKCEAQNGEDFNEYTITISRAEYKKDATLKSLKVNGELISGFNPEHETYTVKVSYETTSVYLEGVLNDPDHAKITANDAPQSKPYDIAIGNGNLVTITVQAEDPNVTKTYKITIERDADKTLSGLEVLDKDGKNLISFDPAKDTYDNIEVPYTTDEVTINAVATGGEFVTITGDGLQGLDEGDNTLEVIVETNSGVKKPYTIKIKRANGKTENYIETYTDEDGDEISVNKSSEDYEYVVARNVTVFNPTITVSDGASYKLPDIKDIKLNQPNTFKVIVTSENEVEREYTFTVYRAEDNFDITDINVLDKLAGNHIYDINDNTKFVDYKSETTEYEINVASSTDTIYLEILSDAEYATYYVNGKKYINTLIGLDEGENIFEIYVVSEYGMLNSNANSQSPTYTVVINREPVNTDSTLRILTVKYIDGNDKEQVYTASAAELAKKEINISNIGDKATSIYIFAEANVPAPKTSITGDKTQLLPALSVSGDEISGYIFTFEVICTAEDDSFTPYVINIARGPLKLDTDNSITYIDLYDSMEIKYLEQANFSDLSGTTRENPYKITIPYGPQSYTIKAHKLPVSPATIVGDGQTKIVFTDGNMVTLHEIYAVSAEGKDGTKYYIEVTCEAPSNDATLKDLKVFSVTVPGFTSDNTGPYILETVPNGTTSIDISAVLNNPNATMTGNIGTQPLKLGPNTFSVTVTAQDGKTQLTYIINVIRDYPLPYLTDLEIIGEKLLNQENNETLFDKEVRVYHAVVTFMDMTATINASVDNPTHIVACNNSTVITNTGTTRTFTVLLNEGVNRFTISVTSAEGKKQTYEIVIKRRGLADTNTNILVADILEIEKFKDDYSNLQSVYEYTVPNKIRDLNVNVTVEHIGDKFEEGATYKVYNDKNLKVGLNQVIILIIAADTETTRAVLVNVTRLPMEFTVNKEATEYTCTQSDKDEMTYVIDLGKNDASAITDYTKYIEFAEEDNLSVEVLTDTEKDDCREVIVRVSDGSEEQLVRFELLSTATTKGSSFNFVVWLLLAVAIVILGTILICVNKDKYGTISKKRKNA